MADTAGVTIDLQELLEAGAHFGHQAKRWNPKMKKYIFTTRDGVHIIDLAKTAKNLKEACDFVTKWVSEGKEVVFVGAKRQAKAIVKEEAINAGAPYVTERWLGGILTNWEEIDIRIKKLTDLKEKREQNAFTHYTKKERLMIDKEILRLERFFGGLTKLKGRPDALFVVDTHRELVAVTEAKQLNVPVIGMVDTNADPGMATFVIPINDDAVRSIKLIVTKIAEAYVLGKANLKNKPAEVSKVTETVKPVVVTPKTEVAKPPVAKKVEVVKENKPAVTKKKPAVKKPATRKVVKAKKPVAKKK